MVKKNLSALEGSSEQIGPSHARSAAQGDTGRNHLEAILEELKAIRSKLDYLLGQVGEKKTSDLLQ